jgi:hypothetical protein
MRRKRATALQNVATIRVSVVFGHSGQLNFRCETVGYYPQSLTAATPIR